jgi:hypothetical protein
MSEEMKKEIDKMHLTEITNCCQHAIENRKCSILMNDPSLMASTDYRITEFVYNVNPQRRQINSTKSTGTPYLRDSGSTSPTTPSLSTESQRLTSILTMEQTSKKS